MYISIRKNKSKKTGTYNCYLYLCLSQRVDGKVKTNQCQFATLSEYEILDNVDYIIKLKTINSFKFDNCLYKMKLKEDNVPYFEDMTKINFKDIKEELWNDLKNKLESFRKKIIEEENKNGSSTFKKERAEFREKNNQCYESYSSGNNNNYNYNSTSDIVESKYTDEEKELFKIMFKDMAKKYHPDIAKDNGEKMKLLLKIKENIM